MIQVVVPYDATNASVRARAIHWLERYARRTGRPLDEVANVIGPGFGGRLKGAGTPTLLVRNARKLSRGRFEANVLRRGDPGVYDLDDGLPWDDGRLPGLGRWWKRPWPRSLLARRCAVAADRVIAGNVVLADWATAHCRDVRIVPTCVEPADYSQKARYDVTPQPVFGWLGSPPTEPYLVAIAPALRELNRRHGARVEIVSGGGPVPHELAGVATKVEWTPHNSVDFGCRWDVGLMPLADGIYERAKCGYKLLQYAAAGLPSVGSPVGVGAVMLAEMGSPAPVSVDEWIDALDLLLTESDDARAARGAAGRALAARYSYDAWEATWTAAVGLVDDGT